MYILLLLFISIQSTFAMHHGNDNKKTPFVTYLEKFIKSGAVYNNDNSPYPTYYARTGITHNNKNRYLDTTIFVHEPSPSCIKEIITLKSNKIIGSLVYTIINKTCKITLLFIDKGYQRKGFGSLLLHELEEEMRLCFVCDLLLSAYEGTESFYQKNGFITVKDDNGKMKKTLKE